VGKNPSNRFFARRRSREHPAGVKTASFVVNPPSVHCTANILRETAVPLTASFVVNPS
jgi:hypothetical protein